VLSINLSPAIRQGDADEEIWREIEKIAEKLFSLRNRLKRLKTAKGNFGKT
jgi:hypothetical protein